MTQGVRRLAAMMITDIVGYTVLTQRDETLALALLEAHHALCRAQFAAHHGTEIKTLGDGFLVAFSDPVHAVQCAIDIQQALQEFNQTKPPEQRIMLRIGIHWDHVVFREGDVFGNGVNVAARLEALCEAGGVCLSAAAAEPIKGLDVPLVSLGEQPLKNIQTPLEIYKIALPGALERATLVPGQAPLKAIAVLPFANLSAAQDNEYFSDGLTEDITIRLTRIAELKVISRISTLAYKHTHKPLRQIGEELKVGYLLTGSVRMDEARVRINAQLVKVDGDRQLWSQSYDRKLTDIFEIQIEVAQKIAAALEARLSSIEKQRIERTPTDNLEAYQLYLKGRYHWAKRTQPALHTAIGYFNEARDKDPQYAQAYAGLSQVYCTLGDWTWSCPKDVYPHARANAQRALTLNPLLAKALTALAHVRCRHDWQWVEAERDFRQALKLNPSYSTAHHWYGECLAAMGRLAEAQSELERARELDPFSLQINASVGLMLYFNGQTDQAIDHYQNTLAMNHRFFAAHLFLGLAYLDKGLLDEAIVSLQQAHRFSEHSPLVGGWLAYAYAKGKQNHTLSALVQSLQAAQSKRYVSPLVWGLVAWGQGQKEAAFKAFEGAFEDRTLWLAYLLHVDPLFAKWRDDGRCVALLRRMRLDG